MADSSQPQNRKQRRAAARETGKPIQPPMTLPNIKMAHPDRSGPKTTTLMDLYEERKSLLDKGQPFNPAHDDGQARDEGGNILEAGLGDGDPIGPVGNAIFWSIALGMVHFTFDVLVYNQYRQQILWKPIFGRTATVLPVLFALKFAVSSKTALKLGMLLQLLFFAVGVAAGCYTIHITNRYDYYSVMKQAPGAGTLWIWSVIEMKLEYALLSIVTNLAYLWWKSYTIF